MPKPNFSARQAERVLLIERDDAEDIVERIVVGGDPRGVLMDLSEYIQGAGVRAWHGFDGGTIMALYVDVGDDTDGTVIYDVDSRGYVLSDLTSYQEDLARDAENRKSLPGGNIGGTSGGSTDDDLAGRPGGEERYR